MKTKAEILNAIPSGMDLETYFDSLTIFEKREMINELEICKSHFTKNLKPKIKFLIVESASSWYSLFFDFILKINPESQERDFRLALFVL